MSPSLSGDLPFAVRERLRSHMRLCFGECEDVHLWGRKVWGFPACGAVEPSFPPPTSLATNFKKATKWGLVEHR